jgi:hypothetical protein
LDDAERRETARKRRGVRRGGARGTRRGFTAAKHTVQWGSGCGTARQVFERA